jgi:hypothetical protein
MDSGSVAAWEGAVLRTSHEHLRNSATVGWRRRPLFDEERCGYSMLHVPCSVPALLCLLCCRKVVWRLMARLFNKDDCRRIPLV